MMRHGFLVVLLVTLWALWWDERRYELLDGLIVTRDMALKNRTTTTATATRRRMRIPQLSLTPVRPSSCHVKFIDPKRAFCYSSRNVWDQIALNISLKLLEYEGGCSTSQLPILDLSTVRFRHADCLHVRHRLLQGHSDDMQWSSMDQHYLVPYFYSAYYALPTMQRHVPWTHCVVMGDFGIIGGGEQQDFGNATIIALNNNTTTPTSVQWTDLYNQVRYCDTIITNNNQVLVLADSLQIPAHGVGGGGGGSGTSSQQQKKRRRRRRRRPSFEPLQKRLNVSHAQAVANTFPIELFTSVTDNEHEEEKEEEETFDDEEEEGTFDDYDGSKTLVIVVDSPTQHGDEVALQSLYENVVEANNAHLAILSANSTSSILTDKASFVWTLPSNWTNSIITISGKDSKFPLDERSGTSSMLLTRHLVLQRLVEFNLTKHYDRFIVTQSNFIYQCPHDVSQLDDRYIWVPNGDGDDLFHQHVVANAHHIQSVLNVLEPLVTHPERYFEDSTTAAKNLTVETLVQRQWIAASLFPHLVRRFPRPMYAAVVATAAADEEEEDDLSDDDGLPKWGTKKRRPPPRPTTEEGVYAVNPDYEFATCVCNHGELVYSTTGKDDDGNNTETSTTSSSWNYTDGYQDFTCGGLRRQ